MTWPVFAGDAAFTRIAGPAPAPKAWASFCQRYPQECTPTAEPGTRVSLSLDQRITVAAINARVNHVIRPRPDLVHHGVADRWDFAEDGAGDCEDIALVKRRELIVAGFPREALLLTVVWTRQSKGHMVLMLRAVQGDFVLDSLTSMVLLWSHTRHRFVKRQTEADPNRWVYIDRR